MNNKKILLTHLKLHKMVALPQNLKINQCLFFKIIILKEFCFFLKLQNNLFKFFISNYLILL